MFTNNQKSQKITIIRNPNKFSQCNLCNFKNFQNKFQKKIPKPDVPYDCLLITCCGNVFRIGVGGLSSSSEEIQINCLFDILLLFVLSFLKSRIKEKKLLQKYNLKD